MNGRYCAYLRKSRADEVREKVEPNYDALSHHRQTLEALAARMEVPISRWYSDGIKSGDSISARPEMTELLSDVESGMWDGVLVMEVERLTRGDMVDQGTVGRAFAEAGTLIITPYKVYDPADEMDSEFLEFNMFMSRREYKAIKKRLIAGRVAAVREGQYIAANAPYGYDKATVDGKHTLVPNACSKYVRAVFERFAEGDSYRQIAHMLDAMGAPPARSAKWSPASVKNIVKNPAYAGKVLWNATTQKVYKENGRTRYKTVSNPDAILVDGLHDAIVDDELWRKAKSRVDAAPKKAEYKTRNHYGRILVCAECGKALHYYDTGNAKEPMMVHLRKGEGCKTKGCSVRILDEAVTETLAAYANDIELKLSDVAPDMRRESYEKAIAEAHATIDANFDRMERGVISEDDFVARRKVLECRIADAEAALSELPQEESARDVTASIRKCIEGIANPNIDEEVKRKLIWSLVEKIEYRNRAPIGDNAIELHIVLRRHGLDMY